MMKLLTLAALVAALCIQCQGQGILGNFGKDIANVFGLFTGNRNPCERNLLPRFHDALSDFSIRMTKRASFYSNGPFIISPYTIWLSLAAISEFADRSVQKELFAALNLPEEKCMREKFYEIALNIESKGDDVRFERNRAIAIDERAVVNEDWKSFLQATNILGHMEVPFDAETFENVPETMGITTKLNLDGHSILLDRLDYEGLWTSAFSEGDIERAPFYNDLGKEIATVDYLRMKSRVRLAHIPIINAKVLELPIGSDGRYSMLLTMGVNNNTVKRIMELLMSSIIVDIMSALTWSLIPIEVAIPKFSMSAGLDARVILEDMGLHRVFSDPDVTRYISDPPALPSGYLQKVSINVTSGTLGARRHEPNNVFSGLLNLASNTATGLASAVGRDFIANRPFIFNLVDTKTRVSVFTGVYSYEEAQRVEDFQSPNGRYG